MVLEKTHNDWSGDLSRLEMWLLQTLRFEGATASLLRCQGRKTGKQWWTLQEGDKVNSCMQGQS